MNFQQLRFAVAVADAESFTKAAEVCCVTQPALSNAISQLEEELGAKLFQRTTRSVTLTKFGAKLIEEMRGIGDSKDRLYRTASELLAIDDNSVRIGVSPLVSSDFVGAMLSRIKAADASLSVILTEMNKNDVGPGLQGGVIDFGLVPEPTPEGELEVREIYSEPLLYISGERDGDRTTPVRIDELEDKQMLMVGDECGLSMAIRRMFMENQLHLTEYEGRALSYQVLEKWTQLGIGVALLPSSKIENIEFARRLNDRSGDLISLGFQACWKPSQQDRQCFPAMLSGLQPAHIS